MRLTCSRRRKTTRSGDGCRCRVRNASRTYAGWCASTPARRPGLSSLPAFDDLGAAPVSFKTDALNARSRSAIARLGAREDGTLRHARLRNDGSVRDSTYFSILAAECPQVRAGLQARLE